MTLSRAWKVLVGSLLLCLHAVPGAFAMHGGDKTVLGDLQADIFHQVTWVSIAVFVIVEVMLLYFLVRYRKRKDSPERGPEIHGNTKLEVAWTIGPALVMVWLLIISFNGMQAIDYPDIPDDAIYVDVVASQFSFSFTMPDGTTGTLGQWEGEEDKIDAVEKLEFRAGTTVVFNVTSTDVIHAFSSPELGFIIDANPGRPTQTHFVARDPGAYIIQCRQYCGVGHGGMTAALVVYPEDDPRIGDFAPRGALGGTDDPEGETDQTNGTGGDVPADVDQVFDIVLKEWAVEGIEPADLVAGEKVHFRIVNEGPNAPHNFALGTFGDEALEVSETIHPGQTTSFTYEVPGDAAFDYWCDIPGHASQGMLVQGSEGNVKEPRLPGPHPLVIVALLGAVAVFFARRR